MLTIAGGIVLAHLLLLAGAFAIFLLFVLYQVSKASAPPSLKTRPATLK